MNDRTDERGKPPKNAASIRAVLEGVRHAGAPAEPGPESGGMADDAPLVIASFYDTQVAEEFLRRLAAAGVMSASLKRGFRQDQVLVDYGDRRRASDLLQVHLAQMPDRFVARYRRTTDFALLGAAIGGTLGAIGIASESANSSTLMTARGAATALGFTLYGALLGAFLGQVDDRIRSSGRFQFSVRDILLTMTIFALLLMSWRAFSSFGRSPG
jgi:hypothetical protein